MSSFFFFLYANITILSHLRKFRDDFVYLCSQHILLCHDVSDALVEFVDVDLLRGVLRLYIRRHADVGIVVEDVVVGDETGEVVDVLTVMPGVVDMPDVVISELILVALMDKLLRGVDEEDVGIGLALLQHDDAGGNGDTEEQVVGQLNDRIDEVVLDEVAAYLLLSATTS